MPPSGRLKINFNGAWCRDSQVGGLGVVVRDDKGFFVAAACMNFQDILSPLQAEAMAERACSSWADSRGFRNFFLEGDSLQIEMALRDASTNTSSIGQLVEDTKSILGAITEELCTHVRRQANTVANRLARFSLNVGSQCEWSDQPPSFIIDLLIEDTM
ncbi:uncharacterized protein [Pyrus communis]|uniref:uncharacterized protein n=1 Tax=Pyrus communis TaxID=23211 RepID=UPI0035BECEF6